MKTLETLTFVLGLGLAVIGSGTVLGCGSAVPPKELVDARATYDRALAGQAKELAPAELDTAKQDLRRAELMFEDEGDSRETKDLAYVANRKGELAEAQAALRAAERKKEGAEKELKKFTTEELARARDAVKNEKEKLEAERKARAEAEKGRAEAEKGRTAAEKALAAALQSLKEIAQISEEKRGLVITLSGAVLFASGKSELLAIAKEKLSQVSKMLKDQGYPPIRVEGHTDSVGSAEENRKLSLARADSVKNHLVSDGYPAAKITTKGLGPDVPVADNGSPEGRANNRRVEIIVNPKN